MSRQTITLRAGKADLATLRNIDRNPVTLQLHPDDYTAVKKSAEAINRLCDSDQAIYGINTGFGKLAGTRIEEDKLAQLQSNLLLSHSCGTGPLLPDDVTRLLLTLKILSLARGLSGVSTELIEMLIKLVNNEVYPCIPAKGSVGASGDLAPLSHLGAGLMGVGDMRHEGKTIPAREGLEIAGLDTLGLRPKEGVALINGTQASTAIALHNLFLMEDVFASAIVTGCLSIDAMKASDTPFDARIHEARGQAGQIDVAAVYRNLMEGSAIRDSHLHCPKVQDPYSLRCQPQVMGATLDNMRNAARTLLIEANAVTDNPLVFSDSDEVLTGGNFHGEPVAMAADTLAVGVAEIGAISERRIATLVDDDLSPLPPFLVEDAGMNSGFMIAQVTAAALASENKSLAHPASVDSLPTSANQEDHVSMSTYAAWRLGQMLENTQCIVAIELLAATQGIEFHRPHRSSDRLEDILNHVRKKVDHYDKDRFFQTDIQSAQTIVGTEKLTQHARHILPSHD